MYHISSAGNSCHTTKYKTSRKQNDELIKQDITFRKQDEVFIKQDIIFQKQDEASLNQSDSSMLTYKLSIYDKIEEWSAHADRGDLIWISISDECFAAMQQNPSYEDWVLDKIHNFYSSCKGDRRDTIAVLKFGPQESDYQETVSITPAVKYRSFYLPKFPSAALDFLVVATTTPSKIRLADENLFCVKFSDI